MRRFQWRLQRLLDIKDKTEQVKRAELLQIGERLAEAHAVVRLQKRLLQQTLQRVAHMEPSQRMAEQPLVLRQASYNEQHIQRLQGIVTQLEQQKDAKTQEVLGLRREREALERLREKALADYVTQQEQLEQKEMDEQVAMGYARKRQNASVVSTVHAGSEQTQQGDQQ